MGRRNPQPPGPRTLNETVWFAFPPGACSQPPCPCRDKIPSRSPRRLVNSSFLEFQNGRRHLKIYTRTGDTGATSLFGGQRVSKADLRVCCYGEVDELNAVLGMARVHTRDQEIDKDLESIQVELFTVGADLPTPPSQREKISRVQPEAATRLEALIDLHEAQLPPLTRFVLPAGGPAGSALHLARTVARRAERTVQALSECKEGDGQTDCDLGELGPVLVYLNRLSDLLFVLARRANHLDPAGPSEVLWDPSS